MKVDVPIVVGASSVAIYSHYKLEANKEPTEDEINGLNKDDVNPIDRPYAGHYDPHYGDISNAYLYTSISAFTLGASLAIDHSNTGKLMVLAVESLGVSGAATQLAKALVRRFRPRAWPQSSLGLGSKLKSDQTNSFFSGHASTISASSAFFAKSLTITILNLYTDLMFGLVHLVWVRLELG